MLFLKILNFFVGFLLVNKPFIFKLGYNVFNILLFLLLTSCLFPLKITFQTVLLLFILVRYSLDISLVYSIHRINFIFMILDQGALLQFVILNQFCLLRIMILNHHTLDFIMISVPCILLISVILDHCLLLLVMILDQLILFLIVIID
jgi:hypothetical protein